MISTKLNRSSELAEVSFSIGDSPRRKPDAAWWIRLERLANDFGQAEPAQKTAAPRRTNKLLKEPKWSVGELAEGKLQPDDRLGPADVRRIGQLSQLDILDKDIPAMLVN